MKRYCLLAVPALLILPFFQSAPAQDPPPLQITEFAPQGMVGSVVAVSLDGQGRAFVTQTQRRTYGALDIRRHLDWVVETLGAQSIEDKRAMIRERFQEGAIGDANGDGQVDWQDLTIPSEQILLLEDTDGDGQADRKEIFAQGFNTEITGLAGGVLAHDGGVYTTIIPSLWHLRDTDGDGKTDERAEIATGFGLHVAYGGHDMHGLTLGPDGKIYWSIGDKALSVTSREGKHYHLPYHGAIMRCDPDGGNFEVFAKGLRNPQELAFDAHGNLFVVDNDADFGDQERFHYVLEGSDAGWRACYQYRNDERLGDLAGYNVWMEESLWKPHFPGQTAAITPCLTNFSEGPAGFTYNPGTALSESYENHFFLTEFPGKRLQAFQAEPDPDSAGFVMGKPRVVLGGQMLVGINFGPDGALYGADWGDNEWLPHENGRVLRMDVPENERHPMREETAQWLREDLGRLPEGRLLDLLGYPDQRVRLAAQFEIVRRGDFTILRQTAVSDSRMIARIHAIWGCAQLVRMREGESLQSIAGLAQHDEPEIRAQVLRALGETGSGFALELVKSKMFDSNPRVRLHAALAMHHLAGAKDLEDIVDYIAANGDEDVFRRHGGVRALTGAARDWPELLVDFHEHDSVAVRLAAVVAIRRLHETDEESKTLEDPEEYRGLARFLGDENENVITEAARGIHDVMHPGREALQTLGGMLGKTKLTREPLLRRVINANRLLGDEAAARRLLAFAVEPGIPPALRREALESAATWTRRVPIDRVLGFARVTPAAPREAIHAALDAFQARLMKDPNEAVIDLIQSTDYQASVGEFMNVVQTSSVPVETRVRALEAVAGMEVPDAARLMQVAAASGESAIRQVAHRYLAQQAPDDAASVEALTNALGSDDLPEAQQAYRLLGEVEAVEVLRAEAKVIHQRRPAIRLDLIEAVESSEDLQALAALAVYQKEKPADDPLAEYRETLAGGDVSRGRAIFFTDVVAQCVRCHQVDGRGGEIGPALDDVAQRLTPEKLLESLILPQAEISPGYGLVSLTLSDGSVVAGNLIRETGDILVLLDPAGATHEVDADRVTKRTPAVSSMPPLAGVLPKRALRDLVAYLVELGIQD